MNGDEQLWRWSNEYFTPGTGWEFEGNVHSKLIVPYWAIVIPPIALSAYLLLSRPRKKQPAPQSGASGDGGFA